MPPVNDGFYVGYQPKAPQSAGRLMKAVVVTLFLLSICISLLVVTSQQPFASSSFEFGTFKPYQGVLLEQPYPMLLSGARQFLLVAPGKRGVAMLFRGKDTRAVSVEGSLIQRGEDSMLEIRPESIQQFASTEPVPEATRIGRFRFRGEIVDTKCHFGVMNPGSGKVHRDCAIRCISGGIPPGLFVRDAQGQEGTLLLADLNGNALGRNILPFAGKPVNVSGDLYRLGKLLVFRVEPGSFRKE